MQKLLVILLKRLEILSAVACRLTQLTGKASVPTHPKHLVDFGQYHYIPFLEHTDYVLDLGCSKGEQTFQIAPRVKRVTGLEKNPDLIQTAKKEAKARGFTNIIFIRHNLEQPLPLKTKSFNKVNFLAVLEHLDNRDLALSEVYRVLKANGMLFLSIPNKDTSWKKTQRKAGIVSYSDPDHKHEFSYDEVRRFLKKHGFKIIKTDYAGFDTPLAGPIDLIGGLSLTLYTHLVLWRVHKAYENPIETSGYKFVCKKLQTKKV